ncbi:MAG: pyruvate kinase [Eubacteriaceae bacterium]|jgi:pyruvate kinase
MKRTKIVCTLGPASSKLSIIKSMIEEGMNVARLNFSHGDHEEHKARIELVKQARQEMNVPIAIMLDTKGPEIRTGLLKDGQKVELKKGQEFTLTTDDIVGDNTIVSVSHDKLPQDISVGDIVLIDDGLIGLGVDSIEGNQIHCVVTNEGVLGERKSINVPNVSISLPGLTEKDESDLLFGIEQGIDFVAASFIRKSQDVIAIRHILDNNGGGGIKIISKIESQEGVDNIDKIIDASDGIMVARGDLGVEVPAEEVPLIQKDIIHKCNKIGKPVITATQMLDSMIRNPRPTRAEVADVANAVFDGTDAVMLSGESAAGEYPALTVHTMANIVSVAEVSDEFKLRRRLREHTKTVTNAVCEATVGISANLETKAIIAATSSGNTARALSKFRPDAIILATSYKMQTIRQLCLSWGVYGLYVVEMSDSDTLVSESVKTAVTAGWLHPGERIVIAAGIPVGATSVTNMIRVHTVGDAIIKGIGSGKSASVQGIARVVGEGKTANFHEGDILVVQKLTPGNAYLAEEAAAVVTELDAEASKHFLVDLTEIPVVVGATGVLDAIKDGALIRVDSSTGLINQGNPRA